MPCAYERAGSKNHGAATARYRLIIGRVYRYPPGVLPRADKKPRGAARTYKGRSYMQTKSVRDALAVVAAAMSFGYAGYSAAAAQEPEIVPASRKTEAKNMRLVGW